MATANPYNAPRAQVAGAGDAEYGEVRVFSSRGRIGRLRYLGYSTGLSFLVMVFAGILGAVVGPAVGEQGSMIAVAAAYLFTFFVWILLTIQRSHDMNRSGWLALLMLVPILNLLFYFWPGTDGSNDYGAEPPPNGIGVILLALILPLVFVAGIVAAIALPAYQDYVKRAQVQQSQ
jgi:uncharacterized membrane protein YhaH (DUF805 family)